MDTSKIEVIGGDWAQRDSENFQKYLRSEVSVFDCITEIIAADYTIELKARVKRFVKSMLNDSTILSNAVKDEKELTEIEMVQKYRKEVLTADIGLCLRSEARSRLSAGGSMNIKVATVLYTLSGWVGSLTD